MVLLNFIKRLFSRNKLEGPELEAYTKLKDLSSYCRRLRNVPYFSPYSSTGLGVIRIKVLFNNIYEYKKYVKRVLTESTSVSDYVNYKHTVSLCIFFRDRDMSMFKDPRKEFIELVDLYEEFKSLSIRSDYGYGKEQDLYFSRVSFGVITDLENFFNTILQHT